MNFVVRKVCWVCLALLGLFAWGQSTEAGIYVENLTLTVPDGGLIGHPVYFTASATARLDEVEQEEKDAGSTVWWRFEWWFRAPQPPTDPGPADYDGGWSTTSVGGACYTYESDSDLPSKLVLVRATVKIEESYGNSSQSRTINLFKLLLVPVPTGNTPDLASGCMCINAQEDYKKAKWQATVLPTGNSATITKDEGPVVVPTLENVTDQQVVQVNAPASGYGAYSLDIALNGHSQLHVSCSGGLTFRFSAEAALPTGETGDLTVETGMC